MHVCVGLGCSLQRGRSQGIGCTLALVGDGGGRRRKVAGRRDGNHRSSRRRVGRARALSSANDGGGRRVGSTLALAKGSGEKGKRFARCSRCLHESTRRNVCSRSTGRARRVRIRLGEMISLDDGVPVGPLARLAPIATAATALPQCHTSRAPRLGSPALVA